jgi:DNA-binding FadR family transcriptional regulator
VTSAAATSPARVFIQAASEEREAFDIPTCGIGCTTPLDAMVTTLPQRRSRIGCTVELDETFHERLMAMSNNVEMLRMLRNVNACSRFVRWIDMDRINRSNTQAKHRAIIEGLKVRDEATCVSVLEKHIDRRLDRITSAIKEGYAQIYMPPVRSVAT